MPELPEVETLRRELEHALIGARIESVRVRWPKTVAVTGAAPRAGRGGAPRQVAGSRRVVKEFGRVRGVFRDTHGERLKTLIRRERQARAGGDGQLGVAERHELGELRAKRPKAAESLKRIWALLDHEQRQRMRQLLTEARKDAPRTSG